MKYSPAYYHGFTLFELLIVVALIALLATIVIISLDPVKSFRDGRNSTRYSHVNSISTAIYRFVIDKDRFPLGLDATPRQLGTAVTGCDLSCVGAAPSCLDLGQEISDYLGVIPLDPKIGSQARSGYAIVKNSVNNTITVTACGAEGEKNIFLMR